MTISFPGCCYIGFPNFHFVAIHIYDDCTRLLGHFWPSTYVHGVLTNTVFTHPRFTTNIHSCMFSAEKSWQFQLLSAGTLDAHHLQWWESLANGDDLVCFQSNCFPPLDMKPCNWVAQFVNTTLRYLSTTLKICISSYLYITRNH